ncbi:unnamed protein product, partial [Urochloa humidicola]
VDFGQVHLGLNSPLTVQKTEDTCTLDDVEAGGDCSHTPSAACIMNRTIHLVHEIYVCFPRFAMVGSIFICNL